MNSINILKLRHALAVALSPMHNDYADRLPLQEPNMGGVFGEPLHCSVWNKLLHPGLQVRNVDGCIRHKSLFVF